MLFTRCPDCGTTFRVTDDALQKANGQVRCGRCASVFNAYAELHEPPSDGPAQSDPAPAAEQDPARPTAPATAGAQSPPSEPNAAEGRGTEPAVTPTVAAPPVTAAAAGPAAPPATAAAPTAAAPPLAAAAPAAAAPPPPPKAAEPRQSAGEGAGERVVFTVADVVAQVGLITDEDAETGEMKTSADALAVAHTDAMSAEQVNDVLDAAVAPAPWPLSARPRRSSRWWGAAAALAVAALGAQAIHHFRADLVANAAIGPIVASAYGALGTQVLPRRDVHHYQILDWIATAEPNARGRGSLKITARIKNRASDSQPYPSLQVQLKDRWEAAVGSRVFEPREYGKQANDLMAPGETARAEIEVVDPGPDAYGFELDVCIEVETDVISCGADKVFL